MPKSPGRPRSFSTGRPGVILHLFCFQVDISGARRLRALRRFQILLAESGCLGRRRTCKPWWTVWFGTETVSAFGEQVRGVVGRREATGHPNMGDGHRLLPLLSELPVGSITQGRGGPAAYRPWEVLVLGKWTSWDGRWAISPRHTGRPITLGDSAPGHAMLAPVTLFPLMVTRVETTLTTMAIVVALCQALEQAHLHRPSQWIRKHFLQVNSDWAPVALQKEKPASKYKSSPADYPGTGSGTPLHRDTKICTHRCSLQKMLSHLHKT